MDEIKDNVKQLRKTQASIAFRGLQHAITEHVENINKRLHARLAVRQTETSFEVHQQEKADTLLRISLTGESNIHYTQLVKRHNEMQSGVIYARVSQGGAPTILFSDFPRPNVEVSYREASQLRPAVQSPRLDHVSPPALSGSLVSLCRFIVSPRLACDTLCLR